MNAALRLEDRTVPSRIAELGFAARLPADWIAHELPAEQPDFSDPTLLFPLAIITAPHAAIVFAFSARPAYDDGSLQDWTGYLLSHNGLIPRALGQESVAGVPAFVGEAVQASDLGPMVVRFAFLEDGGRLINATLTAPELLADAVREAWFGLLRSFRLETPRGSRFGTGPTAAQTTTETHQAMPAAAATPATPAPKRTFRDFALADNAASFDPEAPINANLRDRGAGLVPNLVAVTPADRRASLAAGSILAQLDVPFGWHVVDDGKRTLVFEPGGQVQISLNLLPRNGRSNVGILDELEVQMRADYPAPELMRQHHGKIHALGARNIGDRGQPLEQYHLLFPFRDAAQVLRARVTTVPERATEALNLAELVLESCVFDCFQQTGTACPPAPAADDRPEWWRAALALEAAERASEAEQIIRDSCPHIGFASSTAELYRQRMLRLGAAGDVDGARAAFLKASEFIRLYASLATSGGEGAALSVQRDEFRTRLVAEHGSDPEA